MDTGLRVEDRLDGATNFGAWKERMIFLLQENELWDIVENTTTHPVVVPIDATLLAAYTKKSIKAKRFILDAIKDHLIPHLTGKTHAYEMWESLTKLYQSTNENRKMVLREKLKSIKMTKAENVVTYLTRLTQVRDELGAVGEAIVDSDLVRTTLNGVSKQWVVFVEGIVAREKLPVGNVFGMTLFRRRPGEVMYMAVHLQVMRRRMWLLLLLARRSSKGVKREDRSPRVKGRKTWAKSSALHAISLGTMQVSVRTRRRNKQQLQQRWKSFPPSLTRNFP
jgi:hypothetical protein